MVVINGNQDNGDLMERLAELAESIPLAVMLNIRNRIADWLIAGGKPDDNYVWQQVHFAENCAKAKLDKEEAE